VRVGTNTSPKAATLVEAEEPLHIIENPEQLVSRQGRKLEPRLESIGLDVRGARSIDVGASSGGFTDCLLQRGAASVTALDVGYGQMHWRIREDDRVEVIERTNIRTAEMSTFGPTFDVVVSDLSFISLRTVCRQLAALGSDVTAWILLIKPQFEVGRDRVGKKGIVRDPKARFDAVNAVLGAFGHLGLGCVGLIESPITGATGNVEYVAAFRRGDGTVSRDTIEALFDGIST
jgi:23S rRNA (cytidine1920-2'-O)/16S rRNA (cytidine1409-2'-O)-methyltransferase